jgi:hypothetical protein
MGVLLLLFKANIIDRDFLRRTVMATQATSSESESFDTKDWAKWVQRAILSYVLVYGFQDASCCCGSLALCQKLLQSSRIARLLL